MSFPVEHNITQAFGLFMRAAENWDKFITNNESQRYLDSYWYDTIGKQAFPLFSGAAQKNGYWRPGPLAVTNLADWRDPVRSRLPGTNGVDDTGVNACVDYSGEIVDFGGWEVWENSSKQLNLYSPPICVHDVAEITQAKEQLMYMIDHMKKYTTKKHAAWNRENFLRSVMFAGHNFIMTPNGANYDGTGPKFYYDPYTVDANGDSFLYYPAGTDVSTLNFRYLTFQQEYLSAEAPDAATSHENGGAQFTWVGSLADFQKMIDADPTLREDYHYAMPKVLIQDYRSFSMYRGWTLVEDSEQHRFEPVSIVTSTGSNIPDGKGGYVSGTDDYVKCKRISPERQGRSILDGRTITEANPAYFRASIRVGIVAMKDVFVNQIRPTLPDLGSGMKFGAVPGYNGEFMWQNLIDPVSNPYGEIGNFASRFWTYIKPLSNYMRTVAYMYRSCPNETVTLCETDGIVTSAVAIASNAASGDIDADNYAATITLVSKLAGGDGSEVEVVPTVLGTAAEAYILDASQAPTYTIGFDATVWATLAGDETEFTTAATVQIK